MTVRRCGYPTCSRLFGGPENKKYCNVNGCNRHKWKAAVDLYVNDKIASGETSVEFIALKYDEKLARDAAQTPRAATGRTVTG